MLLIITQVRPLILIITITSLFYCYLSVFSFNKQSYNLQKQDNKYSLIDTNLNQTELDNNTNLLLANCGLIPKGLVGPIKVLITNYTEKEIEEILAKDGIEFGGSYRPKNCKTTNEIAILIPYRDRYQHLLHFLLNMHPIFIRQELSYTIYLIEPINLNITFNRGLLLNIGFIESNKLNSWKCYALHDIDLLSEDDRLLYHCPNTNPMHFSYRINKNNYKPIYDGYFGGVSVVNREQFLKANGFSNCYFGWGAEDDDFRIRLVNGNNYTIVKPNDPLGRYYMHKHKQDKVNPNRGKLLSDSLKRFKFDGLNSLKYNLVEIEKRRLYTKFIVDYNELNILKEANVTFNKKK